LPSAVDREVRVSSVLAHPNRACAACGVDASIEAGLPIDEPFDFCEADDESAAGLAFACRACLAAFVTAGLRGLTIRLSALDDVRRGPRVAPVIGEATA
jgi:hypothetical protein